MCRILAQLTRSDPDTMRAILQRLENSAALPGIDVRMTGEIYGQLHMKTRELGLDPNDTTPRELYLALNNLAELHNSFLAKRLGLDESSNITQILQGVVMAVDELNIPRRAWVLKSTSIKRLLKSNPPKHLMKSLNYRSLDSMLKREPANQLLIMAKFCENEAWNHRLLDGYKKLDSRDFENKEITVAYLDELKWSRAVKEISYARHSNIFYTSEVGQIILTPLPIRNTKGLTLASMLTVLHAIGEIRANSSYLKFHQLHTKFSDKFYGLMSNSSDAYIKIAGQLVHWKIIHRHYGENQKLIHPEVFEPHIQPEDLAHRKAEGYLYRFEPALHFWHNLDYVGLPNSGDPISFNLMDVVLNLTNDIPYDNRLSYHLTDATWNEILLRYIGRRQIERRVLEQLEDQSQTGGVADW